MPIRGYFRPGVDRDREARGGGLQQQRCFLGGEHLAWTDPGGAMNTLPGNLGAPGRGPGSAVGEIREVFPGEEARPYILDTLLHAWFVTGMAHSGRVDGEAPSLGVLAERVVEPWVDRVSVIDDRLHVVRDDDLEDAAEEPPGGFEPGDDFLQGLPVGRVEEHVPRVHGGEDQPMGDPAGTAHRVRDQPEPTEIDLQLLTRATVSNPDRGLAPTETQLGDRVAVQRAIRHHHPAPA